MSTQEQRERFEVWARSENYPLGYDGSNGSDYIDAATSCAYMGWQAAEAAAIERCAKAVRSEELCDAGDTADDIAYNRAIDHAEHGYPRLTAEGGIVKEDYIVPARIERCELIQAISIAVAEAFKIDDVQRLGLVVDEAMRKMEES